MSNMSLSDICDTIRLTKDSEWFIQRFEVSIEDLVSQFKELIEEQQEQLPFDLEMDEYPEDYDDR